MDKLASTLLNETQKQEQRRIARGWKAQDLKKAADSVLASANRLEKEMDLEIKYWEQILAVSEDGWPMCRMPDERHVLGVRFGFPECELTPYKLRSTLTLNSCPFFSVTQSRSSTKG